MQTHEEHQVSENLHLSMWSSNCRRQQYVRVQLSARELTYLRQAFGWILSINYLTKLKSERHGKRILFDSRQTGSAYTGHVSLSAIQTRGTMTYLKF